MNPMPPLSDRDRRALLLLALAVAVFLALQFGLPRAENVLASSTPIPEMESRLRRLQQVALEKPRTATAAAAAARELAEAEKGLIAAATPAIASAQMLQIVKDSLTAQGIALQTSEFGQVKVLGEDYAQVPLTVAFSCGVEQWINWMAAIRNAPHTLSTLEMRVVHKDHRNKTVDVRMVVAGYIPASLAGSARRAGAAL